MSSQAAQTNMIKQQLRTGNIVDQSILDLFDNIPRGDFVPPHYKNFANSDLQIPLLHEQRMMTPLEEATVLQALQLNGHECVLEIGTGTGFLTAMLSQLCQKVISIDYYEDFTTAAKLSLHAHHCNNVELYTGDASGGWLEQAPYDVIIFTGGIDELTESHRLQLIPGGKLVAIIGKESAMQAQLHTVDHHNNWQVKVLFETNLPQLINKSKPKHFVF
ncbi:MAG: protein-L-isoaspartate O-methyltransferase family protein [Legionella sp.]